MTWRTAASLGVAFLAGTIPFGLLAGWIASGRDVRRQGSGTIGATNVLRGAGRAPAAATLLLDAGKGALAVLLAAAVSYDDPWAAALAAPASVAGAIWPPWLRFRGGKGVATGAGALGVQAPAPASIALAIFVLVAASTRWVSVASAGAVVAFPVVARVLGSPGSTVTAGIGVAILVLWAHRENWSRLRRGREPRWPFHDGIRGRGST